MARRFDRQKRFAPLAEAGQARLESSSVLLVGVGALGGSLAQSMVRMGVGRLVLADRDVVEPTNLPRQVLFEDRHARDRVPKALAAQESLARIGGPTRVEAHALHVDGASLAELAEGIDLILDGTDNLASRYLINDFAVSRRLAWVYGGVVGSHGLVLPVLPDGLHPGACLRCLFPEPPPAQGLETCETAGVILPAVSAVAALQAAAALRWLSGTAEARAAFRPRLVQLDVWTQDFLAVEAPRQADCPCCVGRQFPFLEQASNPAAVVLCGRNTVQVRGPGRPDAARVREVVRAHAREVIEAGPLLRFDVEGLRITLFPDGRALIEGTEDPGLARAVYDRYVGS